RPASRGARGPRAGLRRRRPGMGPAPRRPAGPAPPYRRRPGPACAPRVADSAAPLLGRGHLRHTAAGPERIAAEYLGDVGFDAGSRIGLGDVVYDADADAFPDQLLAAGVDQVDIERDHVGLVYIAAPAVARPAAVKARAIAVVRHGHRHARGDLGFLLQLGVEVDQQVGRLLVIGVATHFHLAARRGLQAFGEQRAVARLVRA